MVIRKSALILSIACCGLSISTLGQSKSKTNPGSAPAAQSQSSSAATYRFPTAHMTRQEETYYKIIWGLDSFSVKYIESGELIRFSYRILDADKARPLNDKKLEPSLLDPRAGVKLVVPALENVGFLRQSSTPIPGNTYWMAFSNPGNRVRRGDRVSVIIGTFHIDSLVVQ